MVSQSITSPIVPVGAMQDTWALRNPNAVPSSAARVHRSRARAAIAARFSPGTTASEAASSGTGSTESPS